MSTLASKSWFKRVIGSIPEIWYITLLSIFTLELAYQQLNNGWHNVSFIFILMTLCIGLLIKQLFRKSGWIGFVLGSLFSIISFFFLLAMLSEFNEFPQKTAPNALKLIIVGGIFIGTSLFLSVSMWIKGIHRMCMS